MLVFGVKVIMIGCGGSRQEKSRRAKRSSTMLTLAARSIEIERLRKIFSGRLMFNY